MSGYGRVISRFVVGVAITAVLSGCAGSVTSPSLLVATPPLGTAVVPAATIELTGFSVRPFGVGIATNAFFAVDAAGNVYLPGGSKGAALVKMAPDGTVLARWAGFDVVPGQPDTVVGVAVDPASADIWVTDTTADAVVRLASDLTQKGKWGSTGPGRGQFFSPGGIAVDPKGNIVVADMGADRIQTFTPDGTVVSVWDAPGGKTAPYDVAVDQKGNVYASTVQPLALFAGGSKVVQLSPTGSPMLTISDSGGSTLSFPDAAVDSAGNIFVADPFLGLLKYGPDGKPSGQWKIPGMGQAAVAVRVAPSGNIYTLACVGINGDCTLAKHAPDMQLVATWHGSTPVDHPGTMVDVGGNKVYLQCVGSGSPTIVWEAGAQGPGWLQTAQYLMGRLAETSRVCVYDRPGLGWSDPGTYEDVSHWSQAVTDLHTALAKAGEKGPYVMAGGSYGGLLVRLFALTYPKEVAGLVSIDPSHEDDWAGPATDPDRTVRHHDVHRRILPPVRGHPGDEEARGRQGRGVARRAPARRPVPLSGPAVLEPGVRRDLGEARDRHRHRVVQRPARDRLVVHPPDPVHAARSGDGSGEAGGDGSTGVRPRAARVRPSLHATGRAVPVAKGHQAA